MIARADFYRRPSRAIPDGPRPLRIAVLGCGVVGSATVRLITALRQRIRETHGVDLVLTRILVRDAARSRDGIESTLLTADLNDVFATEPDVIIEALGGREPAATFIERALERGISVVSANKTVIAHDGVRLQAIADRTGARLAYEASVGAAVPVLAALRQRGAGGGDSVRSLRAIVNGTCNFILGRMRETGLPLERVVQEAVACGFAEPDPTADISGRDSAEKLCILARAAGFAHVTPADIDLTGIESITPRDLDAAREHGCVVRLVAELEPAIDGGQPRLRVGPAFVPTTHPLAKAKGAENVFVLDQSQAGRLVLQGEGAGPGPTAAAILGDVLSLLHAPVSSPTRAISTLTAKRTSVPAGRTFVRVPHGHDSAERLRRIAASVHVRRECIEAIVEGGVAAEVRDAFVAPMLAG